MEVNIYVFHGEGANFSSAVFDEITKAESWIKVNQLTGTVTVYLLNVPAYDWAVRNQYFTPKKEYHSSPAFIGGFTSASQEHYHYENGIRS